MNAKLKFVFAIILCLMALSLLFNIELLRRVGGKENRQSDMTTRSDLSVGSGASARGQSDVGRGLTGIRVLRDNNASSDYENALHLATATGDFQSLGHIIKSSPAGERLGMLRDLSSIASKMGVAYDIKEKFAILDDLDMSKNQRDYTRAKILEEEAWTRYDEMKREGVIKDLEDQDFANICRKLAENRFSRAFEYVFDGPTEEARRLASAEVAKYGVMSDTMATSVELRKLDAGPLRDEAIAELVIWLNKTGARDEADPWLSSIIDERARNRVIEADALHQREKKQKKQMK